MALSYMQGGTVDLITCTDVSVSPEGTLAMKATPLVAESGSGKFRPCMLNGLDSTGQPTPIDFSVTASPRQLPDKAFSYASSSTGQSLVVRAPGICTLSYPVPDGTDTTIEAGTVFRTTKVRKKHETDRWCSADAL